MTTQILRAFIVIERPVDMTPNEFHENLSQVLPSLGTVAELHVTQTVKMETGETIDDSNRSIQWSEADAGESVLGAKRARRRIKSPSRLR